jgi:hypothetical protein
VNTGENSDNNIDPLLHFQKKDPLWTTRDERRVAVANGASAFVVPSSDLSDIQTEEDAFLGAQVSIHYYV